MLEGFHRWSRARIDVARLRRSRQRRVRRAMGLALALVAATLVSSAVHSSDVQAAPVIAYPNLRVQVPTDLISISKPTQTQRTLDFTHITWNAGDGPLEFRPQLDPATGVARATQSLSTLTGPSTWSFVKTVPVVQPMTWEPPSDYRFPLTGFGLYTNTPSGGVGTKVATSPKVDFCMTPDAFVGGVPNTAPAATPSPSNCGDPNGLLGLSVGWGDLYNSEDAGNNIDISNLPDGTYWLRGQADPGNYFAQSGPNLSVTDTQLQITGANVTVLQQVTPAATRPVVTVTNPVEGATLTGAVTLQSSVSDTVPVSSLQYLLDGNPIGPVLTAAPWTTTVPALPTGNHQLSAHAIDANGYAGTAPAVSVSVPISVGAVVFDQPTSVTGRSSATTPTFATTAPGEVLLALVGSDGSGPGQTATVSGGGLSWSLVKRANAQLGTSEIWVATVANPTANISVTATLAQGGMDLSLNVVGVRNATIGTSAAAGAGTGAPKVSFASTAVGSVGVAVGNDWDKAVARTVGAGQALLSQWLDTATGDSFWSQYTTAPGTTIGQTITLNDTAPTNDRWNLAAVELKPTGPPPVPPTVAVSSPTAGQTVSNTVPVTITATPPAGGSVIRVQPLVDGQPLGPALSTAPYTASWNTTLVTNGTHTLSAVATDADGAVGTAPPVSVTVSNLIAPLTVAISSPTAGQQVSGTISVSATTTDPLPVTSVQFALDGLPLGVVVTSAPYSTQWNTITSLNGSHTLTATATDSGGRTVVSAPVTVTVANVSVCIVRDVNVNLHGRGTLTTPAFHTGVAAEQLLAFVAYDGPTTGGQTTTVTGAGLTWTLVKRANGSLGVSEIWKATSSAVLTSAQVTATPAKSGFDGMLQVMAFQGTAGVGASVAGSAKTGAPSVSLTTTQPQSWLFAVGNDWDRAVARVPATGQVIAGQWVDTGTGDTFWAQGTSTQTGPAGSIVAMSDTSPTNDQWNLVAVEVLAANSGAYLP
ncbi:MAG: Ig-like domain-containing protein [Acidimicrobiales bacterium]